MSDNKSRKTLDFIREIDALIKQRRRNIHARLAQLLGKKQDQDIATTLDADSEHRNIVFSALTLEQKATVLDLVNPHTLRLIISQLSDHEIVQLLEKSPSLVRQKIINVIERSRLSRLIPEITDEERRQSLLRYANYPSRAVGRIMQPEVLTIYDTMSVDEAKQEVAGFDTAHGPIYQAYILDDGNHFVGTIPLSNLMREEGKTPISDLYIVDPPHITPTTTQRHVAQLFREYDLIEAPVVSGGFITGRILVDDVLDVVEQEYTEDSHKFAGITADETLDTAALTSSRRRLPWMIINIFLDLVAVSIIMPFEETIAEVTALAVLMPVISDMGGNVGIQSLTVSTRSLADDKPRWRLVTKELWKEARVGLLNGVILGAIVGVIAYIGWQNAFLGFVVMSALFFNTILASIIGGIIPIIMRKLKKDPAMMSGAVLTTITDFFGFLIFLGLARLFIEHLV